VPVLLDDFLEKEKKCGNAGKILSILKGRRKRACWSSLLRFAFLAPFLCAKENMLV
jgi:hypothetical protein